MLQNGINLHTIASFLFPEELVRQENKCWPRGCCVGQRGCKAVSQCLGCEALGFTAKEVRVRRCKSLNAMKNAVGLFCCRCYLKGKWAYLHQRGKCEA